MLNRHAIVLFLGCAALLLLRAVPPEASVVALRVPWLPYGLMGTAFLLVVVGLFLDNGQTGSRAQAAHLLQCVGAILLVIDALGMMARGQALHLALAELGIALTVLGVWLEMTARLAALRGAVALHGTGDLLFLAGTGVAIVTRDQVPSTLGWVFIVLSGSLGLYAAISNFALQLARLRNPQAGWRFRVLDLGPGGLKLKTPAGEKSIAWSLIEAVKRLDDRHLIVVLPTTLPEDLRGGELPVDELRVGSEPTVEDLHHPPERYGLVFHEQELGRSIAEAESLMRTRMLSAGGAMGRV
jgi:hypothetical protein